MLKFLTVAAKSYRDVAESGYSTGSRSASRVKCEKTSHDTDTKKALDHLLRDNVRKQSSDIKN